MSSNALPLRALPPSGWTSGLANLLRKELHTWWGTRFWLVQSAIWLAVINGLMAMILWVGPATEPELQISAEALLTTGLQVFFMLVAQAAAIGVAVLGQGSIIGEKQSGTAAWVLSKPLSRTAFVTAKLIALAIGVLATAIGLQGAVAYGQTAAAAHVLPDILPFMVGLGVVALHTFFYLALTVMIGTFSNSRGAAIGIPLALLFGQQLLGRFIPPAFAEFLPHNLTAIASVVGLGQPLPSSAALVLAATLSVAFIAAAIWRFGREEL
jgi:ABC-2 type transport system permease protein